MVDDDDDDEESDEVVNTPTKKGKQMPSQRPSIRVIDESKFESFIFIIIFDCGLISFDVDQLVTRKGVTRPKALDVELESMDPNRLKSMLLSCLGPETQRVLKGADASSNRSGVVDTPKNLRFMSFPTSVDVNNINELRIAGRECQDILNVLNGRIEVLESQGKASWG